MKHTENINFGKKEPSLVIQSIIYFICSGRQTEDRFQDFILHKKRLSKTFMKDFEALLNNEAVKDHVLR